MGNKDILEVIRLLNTVLALGVHGLDAARDIGAKLQTMIEEGRNPTDAEWESVTLAANAADKRRRELLAGDPPAN